MVEIVTQELRGIEIEPELPGEAAEIVDLRDARDGVRRPHGHDHVVRSGIALEKHIGAANVRGDRDRNCERERDRKNDTSSRENDHRRSFCMPLPMRRPSQTIRHDVNPAISRQPARSIAVCTYITA